MEKETMGVDELCDNVPREFAVYMDQVRALKFDGMPKNSNLRKIFRDLFVRSLIHASLRRMDRFTYTVLKRREASESATRDHVVAYRMLSSITLPFFFIFHYEEWFAWLGFLLHSGSIAYVQ
jgi:hypothetical protein